MLRPKKTKRRQRESGRNDPGLLLDVLDELNSVASLLKSLPELQRVERMAQTQSQNPQAVDPIGWHLNQAGENGSDHVRGDGECPELQGCIGIAEATLGTAIWRIERIASLLKRA